MVWTHVWYSRHGHSDCRQSDVGICVAVRLGRASDPVRLSAAALGVGPAGHIEYAISGAGRRLTPLTLTRLKPNGARDHRARPPRRVDTPLATACVSVGHR